MNSLKNHLALIVPLVALLFSLESILLVNRTLSDYENKLGKNYAIILASSSELNFEQIQNKVIEAQSLTPINTDLVLEKLQKNISQSNFILLKKSLPYFYSLNLNTYPSTQRLEAINKNLSAFSHILRVESFSKSHGQIYQLLLIIKGSIIIFSGLIALISTLLMFKQIEIWRFEHSERMEIMTLLGAPLWMRNSLLFRLACIDTIIATIIVVSGLIYTSNNPTLILFIQDLGLNPEIFSPFLDTFILLLTGLIVSLISVWIVSIRTREQNV